MLNVKKSVATLETNPTKQGVLDRLTNRICYNNNDLSEIYSRLVNLRNRIGVYACDAASKDATESSERDGAVGLIEEAIAQNRALIVDIVDIVNDLEEL